MSKTFVPQTRLIGATRRIDSDTSLPMIDKKGKFLWTMPSPVGYAEHKRYRRDKKTGERVYNPITVPLYRGISASLARWIRGQVRRNQRKVKEAQKETVDA